MVIAYGKKYTLSPEGCGGSGECNLDIPTGHPVSFLTCGLQQNSSRNCYWFLRPLNPSETATKEFNFNLLLLICCKIYLTRLINQKPHLCTLEQSTQGRRKKKKEILKLCYKNFFSLCAIVGIIHMFGK